MRLSNNIALPELPIWQARSFWVQLVLAASVLANVAGIDLFAALGAAGLGSDAEEVVATGERVVSAWQQVLPLVLAVWAWIERRAPNYRLTWTVPARFIGCLAAGAALLLILPQASFAAEAGPRQMAFAFDLTITMATIVTVVMAIVAWVRAGWGRLDGRLGDLSGRLDRHETRITAQEQTLGGMPAKDDIHGLQLSLAQMHGELRELRAGMTAAAAHAVRQDVVIQRVEQYLLEGTK